MRHIPGKSITAVVCVSALCAFFTMARVTAQEKRTASAQEKSDTKVLLQNAMNHLEEARSDLNPLTPIRKATRSRPRRQSIAP